MRVQQLDAEFRAPRYANEVCSRHALVAQLEVDKRFARVGRLVAGMRHLVRHRRLLGKRQHDWQQECDKPFSQPKSHGVSTVAECRRMAQASLLRDEYGLQLHAMRREQLLL